jgi:hypothetical protein
MTNMTPAATTALVVAPALPIGDGLMRRLSRGSISMSAGFKRRSSSASREKYSTLEKLANQSQASAQHQLPHDPGAAQRRGSSLTQRSSPARRYSVGGSSDAKQQGTAAVAVAATAAADKKVRLSLRYVGSGYNAYMQNKVLLQAQRVAKSDVFTVLEALSGTLIFKSASPEERVLLAHRLRRMVVEDDTYLIREGEECEPAVFMIAAGKATISITRTQPDGTVQEVDVKGMFFYAFFLVVDLSAD